MTGWNISSVVQKTVIRVHEPTMIVRAYQTAQTTQGEAHYKKIFIPLDGSSRAEYVLPLAASLTSFHKAQLILAHVVREPELPRRAPPSQEESELIRQFVEKNRREATRYLEGLQERFSLDMQTHLIIGEDVADTLHSLVERENPDLVVMTAHGYSGSAKRPFGSLALYFIAYGIKPLLIVQDMPESCESFPASAEFARREHPGH
jgi:nucleotide-binding universal stress UspA family protein